MGSIRFDGVRFAFYTDDHPPPHVHCFYGDVQVIVRLHRDRSVTLRSKKSEGTPRNAKRSEVKYILNLAAEHFDDLLSFWDRIHG